eukprot:TRINITY_DN9779_c0_g1_i3.p3 TRINITY_DN9779_c0_g1~~TRINITY_DN9779_c0_g1_i3.p3  ORF type:complete len:118 (-),score=4.19 TRINITY_DN9779_c0_g1_i3:448-801(-)
MDAPLAHRQPGDWVSPIIIAWLGTIDRPLLMRGVVDKRRVVARIANGLYACQLQQSMRLAPSACMVTHASEERWQSRHVKKDSIMLTPSLFQRYDQGPSVVVAKSRMKEATVRPVPI